ncbi:MAG: hypothetical protein ACI9MR_003941, partial [Myxococcota bacterium]
AVHRVKAGGGIYGDAKDPLTQKGQDAIQRKRFGRRHTPSPIIMPDQSLPLRFSHKLHVAQEMDCTDCHSSVVKSVRSQDVNLPPEAVCLDCHDVEEGMTEAGGDPPAKCSTCHPGFVPTWKAGADKTDTSQVTIHPAAVVIPAPNLKFNHRVHVAKGVKCETCHGDMSQVDLATRDTVLPLMETCIGCHDGKQAPDECGTCHLTLPDGRMKTDFHGKKLAPAGWYRDDAHDSDWLYNHRKAAQQGDGYCESCHTPKECVDCHNGVKKPLKVHPNDWILQHPISARKNTPDCQSCHRTQTFCVDCHQASKVVAESPNRIANRLQFHPDGWVEPTGRRGPNHHAYQAQRNIRACASCHTEETCLDCHSSADLPGAAGLNVNPHPPGFVSSGTCQAMVNRNARVCTKCHTNTDSNLRCRN